MREKKSIKTVFQGFSQMKGQKQERRWRLKSTFTQDQLTVNKQVMLKGRRPVMVEEQVWLMRRQHPLSSEDNAPGRLET